MSKILVVDDEPNIRGAFAELLGALGHDVAAEPCADTALARLENETFDLVILDLCMPGTDGIEALRRIEALHLKLPVIVVTGQGTVETAIEAARHGAFDYHLKPFDPDEVLQAVERALSSARMMKGQVAVGPEHPAPIGEAIIGRSPPMQEVFKAIGRVAATDVTVLICGESGTGKELIASTIRQHSLRSDNPLVVVNCAAIPETLLEGELFGYERGAFTGAIGRHIGKFEQADGGTIFLDEIGDTPLGIQAKILRVLQETRFEWLGGNETIRCDVRVLAATNRDLEQAIANGSFRPDLYHRLNVVTLNVPPLRQRRDDIPLLVDYFLGRFADELKLDKPQLADDAMQLLVEYSWPGNVRELQHRLRRAVIFTRGYPIRAADLSLRREPRAGAPSTEREAGADSWEDSVRRYLDTYRGPRAHEELVERIEKLLLVAALHRSAGNQTRAAHLLGLPRGTFLTKIEKYGLHNG